MDPERIKAKYKDLLDKHPELKNYISYLETKDHLTNFGNKRLLFNDLKQLVSFSARKYHENENITFSVLIMDLKDFGKVNKKHGHLTGDKIIVEFAKTIKRELKRASDRLYYLEHSSYRFGGDEFVIILTFSDFKGCDIICKRILKSTKELSKRLKVNFGVRIGGIVVNGRICASLGEKYEAILGLADKMLRKAVDENKEIVISEIERIDF
jgi:diguanylate cyclase (GGDEF)-like protein